MGFFVPLDFDHICIHSVESKLSVPKQKHPVELFSFFSNFLPYPVGDLFCVCFKILFLWGDWTEFFIWILDLSLSLVLSLFFLFGYLVLRMMSMTSHNLDFGRSVLDLVACGCSSSASIHRSSVRKIAMTGSRKSNRGCGARRLVCCRQNLARCRVYSTKTPETLLNGNVFCIFWWLRVVFVCLCYLV